MTPPLRARLHFYRLTGEEFLLLTAMLEHNSNGSIIWASVARLAAYSKLSERTVQRRIRDLCARGILSQLASGKHKPSSYRVNEAALQEDPRMAPYRSTGQASLPGVLLAPVPGEPIPDDFHKGVSVSPGGDCQTPHSRSTLPPLENFPSREKAKALTPFSPVENRPTIGDQMDWKRYLEAKDKLEQKMSQGYGSGLTNAEIHQQQCVMAKLFPSKAKELEELFKRETSA